MNLAGKGGAKFEQGRAQPKKVFIRSIREKRPLNPSNLLFSMRVKKDSEERRGIEEDWSRRNQIHKGEGGFYGKEK